MVFKRDPMLASQQSRQRQARDGDSSGLSPVQEGHKAPAPVPGAAAPGAMEGTPFSQHTRHLAAGLAPEQGAEEGAASPAPFVASLVSDALTEPRGLAGTATDTRPPEGIPAEGGSASSSSPHGSTSGRSVGLPMAGTWSPGAEGAQGFSPSPLLTPGSREGGAPGAGRGGVGSRSSRSYYEAASRVVSSLAHVGSVSARTHHEAAERATRSPSSGASPLSGVSASGRGYAEIAGRAVRLWDSDTLYGSSLEDDLALAAPGRATGLADPGFSFGRVGSFKSLGLKKGFLDRYRVGEGLGVGNWSKVFAAESVRGAGAGPSSSRAASEASAPPSIAGRASGAPPAQRGPVPGAGAGAGSGVSTAEAGIAAIELEGSLPGPQARGAAARPGTPGAAEQDERGPGEASGAGAPGDSASAASGAAGSGAAESLGGGGGGREGSRQGGQGGSWLSRQLRRITEGKPGPGQERVPVMISSNDFAPGVPAAAAEAHRARQEAEEGVEEEGEEEGCYTAVPPMSGYAVKIIEKDKLGASSPDAFESVAREVEAQRALTAACPGQVVRLVEAYEDLTSIFLLMERCEGGDLVAEMLARGAKLEEADVRRAMRNLLLALAHCALHGVVHRDVKPENLLLARPSDLASLKLCDFGLAVIVPPGTTMAGCKGTAAYAAPEVLGEQAYDAAADVWSAGVVAYTLLAGARPFWGKTFAELARAVRHREPCLRGPAWEGVSAEAKEFVAMLLSKEPRLRPSPVQALCHPWIHSAKLRAALPLDWKLLLAPPAAPGAPKACAGDAEGPRGSGEGDGGGDGPGVSSARLEANYVDTQARCVRFTDAKRSRLDKTQRARLRALAKMPPDELQGALTAVLRESVLASPALRRKAGEGGEEGGEGGGGKAEAEGPLPRHLAAVTEEEG